MPVLEQERWMTECVKADDPQGLAFEIRTVLLHVPVSQWSVSDLTISHPPPTSAILVWKQGKVETI